MSPLRDCVFKLSLMITTLLVKDTFTVFSSSSIQGWKEKALSVLELPVLHKENKDAVCYSRHKQPKYLEKYFVFSVE